MTLYANVNIIYRDNVNRFFASVFFHESVSLQPQSIPIGPFQMFSKIRKSRCTGGKIAASINDTGGKFATDINDTVGKFCHTFR